MTPIPTRYEKFWPFPGLLVLALAVVRAVTRLTDIQLEIANYAVSSPLGYVWLHLDPGLARIDWPAGSADFRFSLPMRVLLWLVETTGIQAESTIWLFGFLQIVFMLVAFGYLVHVIFGHVPTTLALTVVLSLSPVAGINLANFGAGLGNGSPVLFYMWAHGFKFLALALVLRGRYVPAALMAALATWCHLTLGLYMTAFIAAGMLAVPRRLLSWHVLAGIAVYVVAVVPLAAMFLGANVEPSDVSTSDWVLMSRLFNWHWHPIETGLFGPLAAIGIWPLLVLAAAYVVARRHVSAGGSNDRLLLGGVVFAALLSAVGIVFSEVWPVPVVMKFAFPRIGEIAGLVLLAYWVRDLLRRMEVEPLWQGLFAGWALVMLVLASPGLALLPVLAFGLADAWRDRSRPALAAWGVALAVAIVLGTVTSFDGFRWLAQELWTPLARLSPLGSLDLGVFGGRTARSWYGWLGVGIALVSVAVLRGKLAAAARVAAAAAVSATLLVIVQQVRLSDTAPTRERRLSFLDVQLWAAANTPTDAVFMGDPSVATGFREYSRRAWYGSAAELAHFATLYDSVPGLFQRGIARLREFGVDPLAVDPSAIALPGGGKYGISVLGPRISEAFNSMNAGGLRDIAARQGVRYLVVLREARTQSLEGMTPVYTNSHYDIYDLAAS